MDTIASSTARWLGILTTGLLVGDDDDQSAQRARRVLGPERLRDLREWFDAQPASALRDAKVAVVEACIAIVHADRKVMEAERALVERIVERAELDDATRAALLARIDHPLELGGIAPRVPHPALRELLLVLAWQIALADGKASDEEHGAYGLLADQLGVEPPRAQLLRRILRVGPERP